MSAFVYRLSSPRLEDLRAIECPYIPSCLLCRRHPLCRVLVHPCRWENWRPGRGIVSDVGASISMHKTQSMQDKDADMHVDANWLQAICIDMHSREEESFLGLALPTGPRLLAQATKRVDPVCLSHTSSSSILPALLPKSLPNSTCCLTTGLLLPTSPPPPTQPHLFHPPHPHPPTVTSPSLKRANPTQIRTRTDSTDYCAVLYLLQRLQLPHLYSFATVEYLPLLRPSYMHKASCL
jgi:hypothetical protein